MIKIHYIPSGYTPHKLKAPLIPDSEVEEFVDNIIHEFKQLSSDCVFDVVYYTAQESVITMFRVKVAEQVLGSGELCFMYEGEILPVVSNGRLEHWPTGFCSLNDNMLDRLLVNR